MSGEFRYYHEIVSEATHIWAYECSLIYGMFQTPGYIQALRRAGKPDSTNDEVHNLVRLRQERYARLVGDTPPSLHVVLDEAVLHRAVGGTDVMQAQIEHLKAAAQLPTVTVQIVPFNAGEYTALGAPFGLFRLSHEPDSEVVFIENDMVVTYLSRPKEISRYREMFDQASQCALGAQESLTYLDRVKTPL